jgi:putative flippase GtrA
MVDATLVGYVDQAAWSRSPCARFPATRTAGMRDLDMRPSGAVVRRLPELVRFSFAGAMSFLLDLGLLVALKSLTPLPLGWVAALAFAAAALVNFALSRQWVFSAATVDSHPPADLARYAVLVVAGLALTTAAVPLLTLIGLDYRLAKMLSSGLVAAMNYLAIPVWVFRPASASGPSTADV